MPSLAEMKVALANRRGIRRFDEGGTTTEDPSKYQRQYNMSQEAIDFLNRQNVETKNPWEWNQASRSFVRQGANAPETMSYDETMRQAREATNRQALQAAEANRPVLDPESQQKRDAYIKQALPLMMEEAKRRGDYGGINEMLRNTNFLESDINRVFGPQGLGEDFSSRLKSGDIMTPVVTPFGTYSYNRSMGMPDTTRSSPVIKSFDVPDYITQTYGALSQAPQEPQAGPMQTPEWLQYYKSYMVTPQTMDRARETAQEFSRVYGRQITPQELDDFMGSARSNIVQQMGLDPKDPANYVRAIAPARTEALKNILRNYERSRGAGGLPGEDFGRYQTNQTVMNSLGFGNIGTPGPIPTATQNALTALEADDPTQYYQNLNRQMAATKQIIPQYETGFGDVSGLKVYANKKDPRNILVGGLSMSSASDVANAVMKYGLNNDELAQLETMLNNIGYNKQASYINQFRKGASAPDWRHAGWQSQVASQFFEPGRFPEAEQSAYTQPINLASMLAQLNYQPGRQWAGGVRRTTGGLG